MKEIAYLPMGTVVTLKNDTKGLMIIGYAPMNSEKQEKIYDYSACLYPEGLLSTDQILMFNHENIETVKFIGYEDEECTDFLENLKELLKNKENLLKEMEKNFSNEE